MRQDLCVIIGSVRPVQTGSGDAVPQDSGCSADIDLSSLICLSLCFRDALLMRSKPEDMVSVLHTNLLGSMFTCRAGLRSMLSNGGAIVNIGEF